MFNNEANASIIDIKLGDVNGDRVQDIVYLVGNKGQYTFFENIRLVIQDGKTGMQYIIPLMENYNIGYDPWLFLGDFDQNQVQDILINLPVGGSGGMTYYYIVSFLNSKSNPILLPEEPLKLMQALGFEAIYINGYKVAITSEKLGQRFILDVSDRKEEYEGKVYDKNGQLIAPLEGFFGGVFVYPIQLNGREAYRIMLLQEISGTSRADGLGYLVTYWMYSQAQREWTLDPEQAYVMI